MRNERILVLQRSGGVGDGMWVPPGGQIENGEEPAEGMAREIVEETGMTLFEPQLLRSWVWESDAPILVHHFVGFAEGPSVRISEEHYDFDWLTPEEYIARHVPIAAEIRRPRFAQWIREMRTSAEMVAEWMGERRLGTRRGGCVSR